MAKSDHPSKLTWLTITILALLALLLGIHLQQHRLKSAIQIKPGTILPSPAPLAAFQLRNDQNHLFTNRDLIGHWSLLFFGNTHCKTKCNKDLKELNLAYQLLEASNQHITPQVVFVSLDSHDTPALIRNYLAKFNHNFIGIWGKTAEISKLARSFHLANLSATKTISKKNRMQKSGTIIVINPDGDWIASLPPPYKGISIAKKFTQIQYYS